MSAYLDWSAILVILSLIGTFLNVKKNPWGFVFWLVSNTFWVVYDCMMGLYSQAFLFLVYDIFAAWGLWSWTRDKRKTTT